MLFLALHLGACSVIAPDEPPVADTTFVEVLVELHLAAARAEVARLEPRYAAAPDLRDSILVRYGLDEARFREAVGYYAEHPEAYVAVYNTVLDRLNAERAPFLEGINPAGP